MISHGNLFHNIVWNVATTGLGTSSVFITWVPHTHDMGLVGCCLASFVAAARVYIMSPISFILNPPLWMVLVDRYRGTHISAPDFAYSYLSAKWKFSDFPARSLELSCLECVQNGAEPVRESTLQRFQQVFKRYGLRDNKLYAMYGLAEHVVGCAMSSGNIEFRNGAAGLDIPPRDSKCIIKIADPNTFREVEEGVEGEIWVNSPRYVRETEAHESGRHTAPTALLVVIVS